MNNFTGVLLAGGRSQRMGRDKALLEWNDQPLWRQSCEALNRACGHLLIAGDRPDLDAEGLGCYADHYPGTALAGLHTGLTHAGTDWITVLPCDLPWPSSDLLRSLQEKCSDVYDAIIPRTALGREPLIACYHKKILPQVTARLQRGEVKVLDLLDELDVYYLEEPELPSGWRRSLRNINTPDDLEKLHQPPPAVSFVADSGTGKTTLLEKLIPELTARGWTAGALKHDAHTFEIDHEGKDSWRLQKAGAAVTAISSSKRTTVIRQHEAELSLDELLSPFYGHVDIVLTEGFRQSALPKIEVHRRDRNQPLLFRDSPDLIAVVSDAPVDIGIPVFNLDEIAGLVQFIEKHFLA